MAIADELTKLETNRANIVAAINSKGGKLAENAGLAACPEAISQLSSAGGTTLWTGHVDEAGLRYIGWDDTDIANLKANICWNEEDDADYAVPQDHKDLWDACEKVEVNGRTMLAYSAYMQFYTKKETIMYLPMIDMRNNTINNVFDGWKFLVALPAIDLFVPNYIAIFRDCLRLLYLNNINISSGGDFHNSCFAGCYRLKRMPLLDTSSITFIELTNLKCLQSVPNFDCSGFEYVKFQGCSGFDKLILTNCAPSGSLAYCLSETMVKQHNISMRNCTSIEAFYYASGITNRYFDFSEKCTNCRANIRGASIISFADTCSLAGVTSENGLISSLSYDGFDKSIVNFTLVKQVCEMMLRGIPNYTADSYPMYFGDGSTVTDDAAGTLQSLVEQCQAMGWAIYNLTINPYTE